MPKITPRADWWRQNRGSRPGPVLRATRDAVGDPTRFAGSRRVTAELALDVADLVDGARAKQDPARYLSAADRLERLLAKLAVDDRSGGVPDGGPGAGEIGDESDPLAGIVGSGPSLGDATDA